MGNTFGFPASLSPHKVSSDIAMVDMVADMEVDMVADMVADNNKKLADIYLDIVADMVANDKTNQ